MTEKKKYGKITLNDWGGDLKQQWYVYYQFRNPDTGKLERQTNIYGDINTYPSTRERRKAAKVIMEALEELLKDGFNPYEARQDPKNALKSVRSVKTVRESIPFALVIAEKTYAETAYPDFKSRVKQFGEFLAEEGLEDSDINSIEMSHVVDFLNVVLERSSSRNRNNTRTALSGFFNILAGNMIIRDNPVEKIPILKSRPEKHRSFSTEQEDKLAITLEHEHYYWLNIYILFVSFGLLRPIENCRLLIEDLSLQDRVMRLKAKNQPTKVKRIPKILYDLLPDFSRYRKTDFVLTPYGPGPWEASEVSRRNHFTKWFAQVKKEIGLGAEYTMYSYRHTIIRRMWNKLRQTMPPLAAEAELMLITGHKSQKAFRSYLRDIDAEMPEDFSHLLRVERQNGK